MPRYKLSLADPEKLAKKYPSRIERWLYQFPLVGLFSHWFFQSLLYMDWTERFFKLGLELFLIAILVPFFRNFFSTYAAWFGGFCVAHTINFLFNSDPWTALRLYGMVYISYEEFSDYALDLGHRAGKEQSIASVYAYGSLVREEWNPTSDLDVRIIRNPGSWNGMRACFFLLCERTRAFFSGFPLDAYVLDSDLPLRKLRIDEKARNLL